MLMRYMDVEKSDVQTHRKTLRHRFLGVLPLEADWLSLSIITTVVFVHSGPHGHNTGVDITGKSLNWISHLTVRKPT